MKFKTFINLLFNKEIWQPGVFSKYSTESSYSEPVPSSELNNMRLKPSEYSLGWKIHLQLQ